MNENLKTYGKPKYGIRETRRPREDLITYLFFIWQESERSARTGWKDSLETDIRGAVIRLVEDRIQ